MSDDRQEGLATQQRLRELIRERGNDLTVVSSHDVREFETASERTCETLPPRVRETRGGIPIVDEGADDAAPPRSGTGPIVVVRPARDHHHAHR
jgi:hypothetical protein